ncbi:hypothetical protein EJB05_28471, partial [Eragrostis curvula]
EKKTFRTESSSVINTIYLTIEESDEVCKGFHISENRNKAFFLGYMVKCRLMAYSGKRKCNNKEDFRNKRLELAAGGLLGRELRAHIRHADRRMVKAIHRNLNSAHDLKELERYLDASIITNGLNCAFSTGSWCNPYKRNEQCRCNSKGNKSSSNDTRLEENLPASCLCGYSW